VQDNTDLGDLPAWGVLGSGISGNDRTVTWFVSGTNLEWKGTPLTLVIMAEDAQNNLVFQKGRDLLRTFLLN
jgi:hypothetical protein